MLLGKQRSGRQDGDLLAPVHGHERGAQRHLGLAKTHVATDQAVHGLGADEVLDHGVDGGALVGRLLEAETGSESLVVIGREPVGIALARGAAGVQVQQLGCDIAHLFGGFAPRLFPLARAQAVQRRLIGADAGVAADQVQLRHRHVQCGLVGVLQVQELARSFPRVDVHQALVAADAVVDVHHRVAHLEFRQVLDQRFDAAGLLLLAPAPGLRRGGEQLGLGDKLQAERGRCVLRRDAVQPVEARRQGRRGNGHALVTIDERLQRIHAGHVDAVVAQHLQQALAPAVALGHQQHTGRRLAQVGFQRMQRLGGAAVHAHVRQGPCPLHRFASTQGQRGMWLREREEVLRPQEQGLGRQDGALGVVLQEAVAVACVRPVALQ